MQAAGRILLSWLAKEWFELFVVELQSDAQAGFGPICAFCFHLWPQTNCFVVEN